MSRGVEEGAIKDVETATLHVSDYAPSVVSCSVLTLNALSSISL